MSITLQTASVSATKTTAAKVASKDQWLEEVQSEIQRSVNDGYNHVRFDADKAAYMSTELTAAGYTVSAADATNQVKISW